MKLSEERLLSDAARLVQEQLDAYNARDIERFMRCWAAGCQYYAFSSTLIADGAAQIRERHVERFSEPNLHGALLKRIVVGNTVIDQEVVTRTFAEGPGEIDVIAIYDIEAGKIDKAWFKLGASRLFCNACAWLDARLCGWIASHDVALAVVHYDGRPRRTGGSDKYGYLPSRCQPAHRNGSAS